MVKLSKEEKELIDTVIDSYRAFGSSSEMIHDWLVVYLHDRPKKGIEKWL